jgi:hypothetical protein
VALACLAATPRAEAQRLYVAAATLESGGVDVAEVAELPVTVERWLSPTRAVVRYEGELATVRAELDTSDPSDFVQVGVGAATRLAGTGSWRVTMRPGTFAPVLRGSSAGVRIALPEGLPARFAIVPAGAVAGATRPTSGPWDDTLDDAAADGEGAIALPDELATCSRLRVHATRGGRATYRTDALASVVVRRVEGRWAAVDVSLEGYVVEGFVDLGQRCVEEGGVGLEEFASGGACYDGMTYGRRVRLAAGTDLYAGPRSSAPFATLRREAEALEPLYDLVGVGCATMPERCAVTTFAGGRTETSCVPAERRCTRSPAEPEGPAAWIVGLYDGDAEESLVLTGWVRAPAEQLPDADPTRRNPGGGVGGCRSERPGWPRPARGARMASH